MVVLKAQLGNPILKAGMGERSAVPCDLVLIIRLISNNPFNMMLLQGRSLNWTAKVQHRFSRNKISVQRTSEWQSVNSQVPLPPSTLLTINNIFIFHYHRSSRFLCCLLGVQKVNMACYMRVVVT